MLCFHYPIPLLIGLFGCLVSLSCTKTYDWNATFNEAGMVNVQKLDSTIKVSLAYSTPNNVLGCDIYGDLEDSLLSVGALKRTQVQNRLLLREVMTSSSFLAYSLNGGTLMLWNEALLKSNLI